MSAFLPHVTRSGKRLNELFDSIVCQIQEMSGHTLSQQDAIEAARNWLGFCETIDKVEKDMQIQELEP